MTSPVSMGVGIFIGGLLLLGTYSCMQDSAKTSAIIEDLDRKSEMHDLLNPKFEGWKYSTQVDKMRETQSKRADLLANDFDPETTPMLSVYRNPNGNTNVEIRGAPTQLGNIQCPNNLTVAVKVDTKPIRHFQCQMGVAGIPMEPDFFSAVKSSKQLTIEVGDGYGGLRQFTFKTEGLEL